MNTLLLSSTFGIFWLVLLFALCFAAVHLIKLARLGNAYRKARRHAQEEKGANDNAPTPAPTQREEPPQNKEVEPVYYIVERKKRTKSSFSAPKQIRFK